MSISTTPGPNNNGGASGSGDDVEVVFAAGTRGPAGDPAEEGDGADARRAAVAPLLARANLLRIRGQWDEAIAVSTDALRRDPDSATAHSLMGDIYEAQGRLDEALQWYGMAVDLRPDSRPDREKLDRVIAAKKAALRAEEQRARKVGARGGGSPALTSGVPPLPADASAPPATRPLSERTLEWVDRVFPPGRSEGIARLIFAMSGALAVVLLVAAGFVYVSFQKNGAARTGDTLLASGDTPVVPPPVRVVVPPRPSPSASPSPDASPAAGSATAGSAGGAAARPAATPSAAPTPQAPPVPPAPADSVQQAAALREALALALPTAYDLGGVRLDPADPTHVLLEVAIPAAGPGETPDAVRERALRAAVFTGRSSLVAAATALRSPAQPQALRRVNVRVSLRPAAGAERGTAPEPVFVGQTTADLLRDADPVTAPAAGLFSLFGSTWWAPRLLAAPTPAPGGAARPAP